MSRTSVRAAVNNIQILVFLRQNVGFFAVYQSFPPVFRGLYGICSQKEVSKFGCLNKIRPKRI